MTYGTLNVDSVVNSDGVTSGGLYGFKNRIINGAMMIDQRNAGASSTPASGFNYNLDRWILGASQSSKLTVQQNAGSVTPPAGFPNYLGVTVGASANVTVGAGDYFFLQQSIEGYNSRDFAYGTSDAQSVTLSFWVRSSLTGTFGGCINYVGAGNVNQCYPFTYSIASANTWTKISVTAPPQTTTAFYNTTNGVGSWITFGFGVGSTYSATANAWASNTYFSATGATSLVTTNSATFYITGVQLEKGSTATSFDYRPYGTELQLAQRYFQKSFPQGTAPAQNAGTTGCAFGQSAAASGCAPCWINFPVVMRATPTTFTAYNPSAANASWRNVSAGSDVNSQLYSSSASSIYIVGNTQTVGQYQITAIHYTVDAEL